MALNNTLTGQSIFGGLSPAQQQQLVTLQNSGVWQSPPAVPSITCHECSCAFSGGIAGVEAQSRDEAVVAAYANGWYIGKNLKICLACRKKIQPDNVDESLLQDNN